MIANNHHHQRISSATFLDNRQYMLALDNRLVYIICDKDHDLTVRSTLSVSQRPLAAEWVAEVARNITLAYGGDPAVVYNMIINSL